LLRHRLRLPGRADRQWPGHRGDRPVPGSGFARLHLRGGHGRGHRAARRRPVHRLLLRDVPGLAARPRRPRPGDRHVGRSRSHRRREGLMNTTEPSAPAITYADSGVDTAAGDRAVELMKEAVAATHGPQVLGGIGAFAGLVDVSALKDYRRPLLASSTDGVGTKIAIAREMDTH